MCASHGMTRMLPHAAVSKLRPCMAATDPRRLQTRGRGVGAPIVSGAGYARQVGWGPMTVLRRCRLVVCMTVLTASLSGCAMFISDPEERAEVIEANDPIEGVNRHIFAVNLARSEERRVGKEWRARWSQDH